MKLKPDACPGALAFASRGRYDIRQALVALYYADHTAELPRILHHGERYLQAMLDGYDVELDPELIRLAVTHGLLRLWRPSDAGAIDAQARALGVRATKFRALSSFAKDMFRQRLYEGARDFFTAAVCEGEPAGRPGGVESLDSEGIANSAIDRAA